MLGRKEKGWIKCQLASALGAALAVIRPFQGPERGAKSSEHCSRSHYSLTDLQYLKRALRDLPDTLPADQFLRLRSCGNLENMLVERNAWRRGEGGVSHTHIMRIIDFQAQAFSLSHDSICGAWRPIFKRDIILTELILSNRLLNFDGPADSFRQCSKEQPCWKRHVVARICWHDRGGRLF